MMKCVRRLISNEQDRRSRVEECRVREGRVRVECLPAVALRARDVVAGGLP